VAVGLKVREDTLDGFDIVYSAQYLPLVRLAYLTTGCLPAAEDVVQDAFIEWYRRRDQVHHPVAYLRRAVVSRCVSWLRRRALERRYGAAGYAEILVADAGDASVVRDALARLGHRQRAAVFLRYYLDLPEVEIAAALGCRPGTVKSLLHRALGVLREQLDG